MLALLLACSTSSPLVGDTLTEAGTWRLVLAQTSYDQGQATLEIAASLAEDRSVASGLNIVMRPDMPSMDHLRDLVDFVEEEPGHYGAELLFDMAGLWTLTGYAGTADQTESYSFVVEVSP
ncbi:MAG TPA: FixH family protein [Myxococcota bacterium]|nr:FixH family protein [Myxococcota bacterium]HND33867.1 FixH family protein [Myxococcota bacterium]HNH47618.1 FixH family protein [Myxococcota bacterium]